MPTYLFTARDREGREVTESIEAPSGDWVVLKLHKDGYSDIVLHTENVAANYTKMVEGLSAKDYLAFRRKPTRLGDAWWIAQRIYWQTALLHVGAIALLGYRRFAGTPLGVTDIVAAGILVLPIVWALVSQLTNWVYTYNRMVDASGWGRWEEVLALAAKLKGKAPPEELAFRNARALAGLGRVSEAFNILKPFGDGQAMPLWMYHARLGEVYVVLKQYDKCVENAELAVKLAPGDPTMLLDLAGTLLRFQPDLPRIEKVLDEVRFHAVSDMLSPILEMTEGALKFEQGYPHEAKVKLESGLKRWLDLGLDEALTGPITDRGYMYLALACARLGDMTGAQAYYQLAAPRLKALNYDDLLERCNRELRLQAA
jgi:tetratricopeptide (TPR) repeat protein